MKRRGILHIIIGFIFIFNSITMAIAQDYRVVEIDSVEYYSAKCGFEMQNYFLHNGPSNDPIAKDFLYRIVTVDEEARDIYLDEITSDEFEWHDFSLINFNNTLIYFLQFCTPIKSFMYLAAKQCVTPISMQYNTPLSISNVKINSAPIVVSKDGYIAGFEDNGDAYYTDLKIYKMTVDECCKLDITELYAYYNDNEHWHVSYWTPFSVFWKNDSLYIEGRRLENTDETEYFEVRCYFKVERI